MARMGKRDLWFAAGILVNACNARLPLLAHIRALCAPDPGKEHRP